MKQQLTEAALGNRQRYRYFLLAVLTVIFAFNLVDRIALGLVVQDIKIDLHLSDTQIGLLEGMAFAFVYALVGIPIARYSDRGNRVSIIVITTALWSAAVAMCGLVGTFGQLVLIRVVVGFGEAGAMPPATSLIADYFSRAERPRANSIYMLASPGAVLIGYLAGGWLNELYGWRTMFLAMGLPGLLLALVAWCFLKEPRREKASRFTPPRTAESLMQVLRTLWALRTYRQLLYAFSLMYFVSYGLTEWTPAYLERSFGMKSGEVGTWLSVIYSVGCVLGTYLVGEWATRRAICNEARQLKGCALLVYASTIFCAFAYLPATAPNYHWVMLWLSLNCLTSMTNGPVFGVIQTLVPERMVATAIALLYLFGNLIGLGVGPWATGALSDFLRPWAGNESLRYALLALFPATAWIAYHFWQASKSVTSDLLMIKREQQDRLPHKPAVELGS